MGCQFVLYMGIFAITVMFGALQMGIFSLVGTGTRMGTNIFS